MKLARFSTSLVVVLVTLGSFASGGQKAEAPPSARPSGISPAYNKAFKLLESGKATEALAEIDAALVQDAQNSSLHNLRGLAALRLGRAREAEASFRKAIQLSPNDAMGYNNLATLFSQEGRHAEAAELFRAALKLEPHNSTARLGLGVTLATLQKYAEAVPYLQEAWDMKRRDFQTGYQYARVLREVKRPGDAQTVLQWIAPPNNPALQAQYFTLSAVVAQDQGDPARAAQFYRKAYELSPQSIEIYLSLARASLAQDAPQPVMPLPPAPAGLSAEQHFTLGLLFASRGAFEAAIPHFEETLRKEPTSYAATYNLALAYNGAGRTQAAIDLIDRSIDREPTAELYNLLASLEETAGHYVDAAHHFERAVELEPTNEGYYFDLGVEYLAHFTFGPALEVFRVGTQKFPGSSRQFVGWGFAHYAQREYLAAAEAFLTALELDPSSRTAFKAWNSLPAFLPPSEWERFLPRLQRLAELHPTSPEAAYSYGDILFRQEFALGKPMKFDLAQSFLERAIRLKPDFAEAHMELGNLHAAGKENEMAVAEFQEAARLDPQNEMAHYRLGQTYRNLNQLELAQQELARYSELARNRREQLARSRSAIKQFVLAQSGSSSAPGEGKTSQRSPH